MDDPPLFPLTLGDRNIVQPYFEMYNGYLSDYSFLNTVIWPGIKYAIYDDCLCVFANHQGLSVLLPPIGSGDIPAAARWSLGQCKEQFKIEYVSQHWIDRYGYGFKVSLQDYDYLYNTNDMITLAGGKFASKRQSKNRFVKQYPSHLEPYTLAHKDACIALLNKWRSQVEGHQIGESVGLKADKEHDAIIMMLEHNLAVGAVLVVENKIIGFTFGEDLGGIWSVLVEKTDRDYEGSAQFIFSEFCRQHSNCPLINAGDSWGIENLAKVKESYRPVEKRAKFVLAIQ